jgi:hypothetical protein
MSATAELKVYRASVVCVVPAWPVPVIFFVIGLGGVTIGARQSYPALNVVIGALALLFSLWLGAVLATNRLIVTPVGLLVWNYLRRSSVSWAEVRSFGVGPSRSPMRWPGLIIRRNDGSVLMTNVVAFTRRYPARIADELAAWQRDLAPGTLPRADLPQGESSGPR